MWLHLRQHWLSLEHAWPPILNPTHLGVHTSNSHV
jgi:hypothetical protein